jgi:hypothetical protein
VKALSLNKQSGKSHEQALKAAVVRVPRGGVWRRESLEATRNLNDGY